MLVSTKMITGFNTDVPYEGHVYHVQTEDRGTDNPVLESLIYIGGTIVATKLTPYNQRLDEGADQDAIASLLKRQHQLIIAAIKAGRIEDLVQHTRKQQAGSRQEKQQPPAMVDSQPVRAPKTLMQVNANDAAAPPPPAPAQASVETSPPRRDVTPGRNTGRLKANAPVSSGRGDTAGLNLDQVLEDYLKRAGGQAKLDLKVLSPDVFTAGKNIGLKVQVTQDAKPNFDATVTVKIIGTAFKPQVFIGRVGRDGVASFNLNLPAFSAGTAAIVIEAQAGSSRGEIKNLIRRS